MKINASRDRGFFLSLISLFSTFSFLDLPMAPRQSRIPASLVSGQKPNRNNGPKASAVGRLERIHCVLRKVSMGWTDRGISYIGNFSMVGRYMPARSR
ncbi:hypothetical protein C8R47DRAFT_1161120 [Mycena vitilis]|nr:hypothetical protein C8R47DRAFT_1161120 [Mycena vitilis]